MDFQGGSWRRIHGGLSHWLPVFHAPLCIRKVIILPAVHTAVPHAEAITSRVNHAIPLRLTHSCTRDALAMTLLVPPPAGAVGMLTDVTVAQDAFARALENLTLASAHRREALRAARSMSRGARACGERLARDVPRGRIGVATAVLDHACKMTLSVYVLSVSMRKSACSSEVRRPVRHLYPRARSVRANGETSISRTQGVRAT